MPSEKNMTSDPKRPGPAVGDSAGSPPRITPAPETRITGAQIGRLVAVDKGGRPLVDYPGASKPPRIAVLGAACPQGPLESGVGHHLVLLFENGDPDRPIIVGWVEELPEDAVTRPRYLRIDGDTLVIEAQTEVQLRCGNASLTLTRDGKVILKGEAVLSEARGVNKIRGSAVRIN